MATLPVAAGALLAAEAPKLIKSVVPHAAEGIGGAVGGLFGKKGARAGKKVGHAIGSVVKKLLPFQYGGVVGRLRHPPHVMGYSRGGRVARRF